MNNTDFRRFVLDTPRRNEDGSPSAIAKPSAPASSLGSKNKSSIPMTPRTVKGAPSLDFARQLAEHNAASKPTKKFRSSAAPKGAKLGEGYTDRAQGRAKAGDDEQAERDEREARIQALEEQMKLGQIERETFEQLRDSITGGDIGATHLVKGLDRQLLERVRKGEDVLGGAEPKAETVEPEGSPAPDADEEFEKLEQEELTPVEREKAEKKGEMAPPPKPKAGTKRSRNDILAELKASRKAAQEAKAASQPKLGERFKKFSQQKSTEPRIEKDERGREVLITVDENGRVKRKVKKMAGEKEKPSSLLMPDKKAAPMGMAVPEPKTAPRTDEDAADGILSDDEDIFEGVGDSFDPLGVINADDDSSEEDEDQELEAKVNLEKSPKSPSATKPSNFRTSTQSPLNNNYFNDTSATDETVTAKGLDDPAILETLKRAATLRPQLGSPSEGGDAAEGTAEQSKPSAAAQRLLQRDRDLDDIDMGFGSSRFGDEEDDGDGGGPRLKLSEWKGGGEEDDNEEGRGGTKQRKRGKKKRKGDKDSAADVLRVMDGRRK